MVNKDNTEFSQAVARSLAKFGLACAFVPFACGVANSIGANPNAAQLDGNLGIAAGKAKEVLGLGVKAAAVTAVVKGSYDLVWGKEPYASR